MDRAPQHQTGRSRRLTTGVALVAAATLASHRDAHGRRRCTPARRRAGVPECQRRALTVSVWTEAENPFFEALGTNGRSCATCHRPRRDGPSRPTELRDRFDRTDGLDPIFRPNDGSNCEAADISTVRTSAKSVQPLAVKGTDSRRA